MWKERIYMIGVVVSWPLFTFGLFRTAFEEAHRNTDFFPAVWSVLVGALCAILWFITVPSLLLALLLRHFG